MIKLNNEYEYKYGVLHQKKYNDFEYNNDYLNHYKEYIENGKFEVLNNYRSFFLETILLTFDSFDIKKNKIKLLEIGFGTAEFLKFLNKNYKNIELYGYDLITKYKDDKIFNFVDNYLDLEYDIVLMFDVIEHLKDIQILKDLKTKYLLISTPFLPKFNSIDELKNWHHFKPNEHLWYFDDKSLKKFMKSIGFKQIKSSNVEDIVRKSNFSPNILTALFKKV